MAGRAEKRLATLLNSCDAGNILDAARSDITALIEDYFLSDQVEEDWSKSDSEDEMENVQDVCDIETEKEDDVAKKLSFISKVQRDIINCAEIDCNGAPAEMHRQTEQWSCHCKQIKAVALLDGDPRQGCINQFSPEECVEVKLSVTEMDRGM